MRSVYGYYEFANLTALENGTPRKTSTGYERSISKIPGVDLPAAQFSVNQLGFYLQDEWTIIPTLKATFGVRVDIPFLPTEPGVNDSVSKYFDGYSTGDVPSGNLMVSPRFGFNWDLLATELLRFVEALVSLQVESLMYGCQTIMVTQVFYLHRLVKTHQIVHHM